MHSITRLLIAPLLVTSLVACGPTDNNTDDNSENNSSTMVDKAAQRVEWEACVGDTMTYTPFETSISTAARVAGFETIGEKLWNNTMTPSQDDFVQSNLTYVEEEGLDSRVARREDEHYAPVMKDGEVVACNSAEDVPMSNPDRCVGPAKIRPLVIGGLTDGAMSMDEAERMLASAEVEASLLWFLYVSTFKEIHTCTKKKKDCDSSYAYYTGAQPEEMGIGLAGYLRREVPEAHAAVWDALLEMRCWRQVDDADTAQNQELRDEVIAKLDKALLFGISRLVTARLTAIQSADAADVPAEWRWLQIMGDVLVREAKETDAAKGAQLEDAFGKAMFSEVSDASALISTIEELFPSAT